MAGRPRRRSKPPIHQSVRRALGYDEDKSDAEVYEDWAQRTRRVCKPCWELKYCPYGPLVEQSPILPSLRNDAAEHNEYLKNCVATDLIGTVEVLTEERKKELEAWSRDDELLRRQALYMLHQKRELDLAAKEDSDEGKVVAWIGGTLPPIHVYRVKFREEFPDVYRDDFSDTEWQELTKIAEENRLQYLEGVRTGSYDARTPLDPVRRAFFERTISDFDAAEYPENIPETFQDAGCNVYGHICPVFFAAEAATETEEERRIGRRQVSFAMKMRIVRRDNYTCQHCNKHLMDDEVEFDHIIPVARGGSSEEHNLRLTCFDCNRDKGVNYIP